MSDLDAIALRLKNARMDVMLARHNVDAATMALSVALSAEQGAVDAFDEAVRAVRGDSVPPVTISIAQSTPAEIPATVEDPTSEDPATEPPKYQLPLNSPALRMSGAATGPGGDESDDEREDRTGI